MKKEKLQYERVTVLQQVEVLLENPIVDSGASGEETYNASNFNAFAPGDDGGADQSANPNIHWVDFD